MKKQLLLAAVAFFLSMGTLFAQAPDLVNYQGVARNSSGQALANQAIKIRLIVRNSSATGTIVYNENHAITTNDFGLYNVSIGSGTTTVGTFSNINWGNGDKYLQVQIDPNGGNTYTNLGTTQLLSVPYAMYAKEVAPKQVVAFRASGSSTTNAALANQTPSTLKLNEIMDDGGNNYNPTSGAFTAPTDGYYHFDYNLSFNETNASNTTGYVVTGFTINGLQRARRYVNPNSTRRYGSSGSMTVKLSQGDVVDVYIYQSLGVTVNLTVSQQETLFSGHKIN